MAEKKSTTKGATSKKGTKSTKSKFDGILVCTTAHLAEMYGVSERQIYNQMNNGTAVKIGANKFDCVKSVQNYLGKIREADELKKQTPKEIETATEIAKLEHERLKARKTELQVLELEGKLHYEEDVKALWNNIVVAAKSKLIAIGVKLAPQLRGETDEGIIKDHIDREIYEALKEISEYNDDDFEQELLGRLEEDEGREEGDDD